MIVICDYYGVGNCKSLSMCLNISIMHKRSYCESMEEIKIDILWRFLTCLSNNTKLSDIFKSATRSVKSVEQSI